ncbi:MAG TPA: glycosyltransferase [Candidatus Saccharimonadales bacterium]|nr:glycosyltransferase [Candidatus Saccharimonadales bacterium]
MATSKKKKPAAHVDRPLLNIIVPVYNEKDNFERLYNEVQLKIKQPKELFVVYDFDEDNTLPVARKIVRKDATVHLIKNTIGRGPLNAIKSGFAAVESGPCLVVMADLSDDLSMVDAMYQAYLGGAHVVCGSRYMKGGRQIGGPWLKRTLSRLAGTSLYYVRGVPTHDVTNNFKLYDKQLLDCITIESTGGFELAMEVTVKAFRLGARISELPTTWRDREAGASNFKLWKWLPSYLHWYWFAFGRRARTSHGASGK